MALSPAGEALLHHARLVMQQVDHLKCDLREYSEGIKGYVRVLANSTAIGSALPAALASFLARHPDVDIHLRQRLSQQIVIDIHEARADIGIVAGDIDTQGLDVHDFIGEDLMVAVPQGHALGGEGQGEFCRDARRAPHLAGRGKSARELSAAAGQGHRTPPWARRKSKVVSIANATMPKLATDLIAHLANFNFEERLL